MALLPKIIYNGKKASNVTYNGKDVLNVVMDGKTVFHKHKEGVCKTRHQGSNPVRCNGTRTRRYDYDSSQFYVHDLSCPVCGDGDRNVGSQPNDGRPAPVIDGMSPGTYKYVTCGRTIRYDSYDCYTYSCGFNET
jgi:hypothetical protein